MYKLYIIQIYKHILCNFGWWFFLLFTQYTFSLSEIFLSLVLDMSYLFSVCRILLSPHCQAHPLLFPKTQRRSHQKVRTINSNGTYHQSAVLPTQGLICLLINTRFCSCLAFLYSSSSPIITTTMKERPRPRPASSVGPPPSPISSRNSGSSSPFVRYKSN